MLAIRLSALFVALMLSGCVSKPIKVIQTRDAQGMPAVIVDGVTYELTDDERRIIANGILDMYCK